MTHDLDALRVVVAVAPQIDDTDMALVLYLIRNRCRRKIFEKIDRRSYRRPDS